MEVIESSATMRAWSRAQRAAGRRIALVPTMGYLHEGHLELVRRAKAVADVVIVSIYVNPAQFAANEDFGTYPRDEEGDAAKLREMRVDAVFAPRRLYVAADEDAMRARSATSAKSDEKTSHSSGGGEASDGDGDGATASAPSPSSSSSPPPPPHETYVTVENLQRGFCAITRPHFFRGVATVVCKLFNICDPDVAVFGKKDYQQWRLVERMTRDLDFAIEIVGVPLMREEDGVAMSSRNVRLTPKNRLACRAVSVALECVAEMGAVMNNANAAKEGRGLEATLMAGGALASSLQTIVRDAIAMSGGEVDYVEVVDQLTLRPVERVTAGDKVVVLVAAKYGDVRLLDNVEIGGEA